MDKLVVNKQEICLYACLCHAYLYLRFPSYTQIQVVWTEDFMFFGESKVDTNTCPTKNTALH